MSSAKRSEPSALYLEEAGFGMTPERPAPSLEVGPRVGSYTVAAPLGAGGSPV
jgi:hypothetical protein